MLSGIFYYHEYLGCLILLIFNGNFVFFKRPVGRAEKYSPAVEVALRLYVTPPGEFGDLPGFW